MRFFAKTIDKLKGALRKTAKVLNTDVRTLFVPGRGIDEAFLTELEEKFLQADMGVSGANFLIADSGAVVLVENEGNARLTTSAPTIVRLWRRRSRAARTSSRCRGCPSRWRRRRSR